MQENRYKKVDDIIALRAAQVGARISKTGYRGVTATANNTYQAHFSISDGKSNKVKLHLGTYPTPKEASIARAKFIDSLK